MLTAVAFLLSFVASALAYMVTFPNNQSGWTDSGPQFVNWTMVDTDPANFSIELTNQQMPNFVPFILVALVEGNAGFTTVAPPSSGWVDGMDYRVDLVADPSHPDTILAQSGDFSITSSSNTSSSSGTSGTTVVVPTLTTPTTTETTGTSGSSASSSASIAPTSSSAAALSYPVQTCLLGLFSLLGFVLA